MLNILIEDCTSGGKNYNTTELMARREYFFEKQKKIKK